MTLGRRLYFPPFCLDLSSDELTSGDQPLHLRPKSFAVLEYLIRHRGRLVAKEDLLDAVWPDTVVEEGALKNCIREVRSVLEDSPRVPKFIQTDHRKGYRFIAAVREEQNTLPQPTAAMVGRDLELARMEACLLDALNGQRQLIFVSGESGIGKTTLVENFVAQIMETGEIRIGCGQCIAHYGEGEAYSPILEALGQLCRGSDGKRISALLRQYAPTWCSQIPALMTTAERKQLLSRGQTEPRDRMLREMAEALELIANEFPLLLYLEDLHWSDASTIDLLALLARRKGAAKLMVVGTLRPADTVQLNAPLTALRVN